MAPDRETAKPAPTVVPALEAQGVEMQFEGASGRYVALRGIDLEARRGEFLTFIGHSGCGKSTLLNLLAGLEHPTAGRVLQNGFPIRGPGPERAMVFQSYSLLPWLTVYANVWEPLASVHRHRMLEAEQRAQVESVLRAVGLWDQREKRPPQLSGGMKQRVAIARAFAVEPEVLLLDEPFGALDALTRAALQDELLRLWRETRRVETVVMVTHDIDEAIYLSDRVAVFSSGPAATIRALLPVDLPRPRDRRELFSRPEAVALRARLMGLLRRRAA